MCAECRSEIDRLSHALSPEARGEQPAPVNASFEELLKTIRQWESAAAGSGRTDESVKWRIASTLERYLGRQATSTILLSVSEEGDNLLSSVEPVLALFLGRTTASRLVSNVVKTAIVRP